MTPEYAFEDDNVDSRIGTRDSVESAPFGIRTYAQSKENEKNKNGVAAKKPYSNRIVCYLSTQAMERCEQDSLS